MFNLLRRKNSSNREQSSDLIIEASSKWRDQMKSMNSIRRQIWLQSGWRGFYKGFSVACLNHVPQSTIFWTTYGPVKAKTKQKFNNELLGIGFHFFEQKIEVFRCSK